LGLGHPLPLSFFLPDVEELWTATLQFLPATWPIKRNTFQTINHGTEKENHLPSSLLFQSLKKWNRDFFEVELLYYLLKEGKTEGYYRIIWQIHKFKAYERQLDRKRRSSNHDYVCNGQPPKFLSIFDRLHLHTKDVSEGSRKQE
jgi:hypothetical protein